MKNKEWTPEPVIKIPWLGCLIAFLGMITLGFVNSCATAAEQAITSADVYRATCRVYAQQSGSSANMGSGTVVGCFGGFFYIITNHHVTAKARTVDLHFFGDGTKVTRVKGEVVANFYDEKSLWDFARIRVKESDLATYNPPFVPMAPADARPDTAKYLITSGCGDGRWASVFKGGVESYYGDGAMFFPAPIQGQSGSGIIQWYNGLPYLNAVLTFRCEVGKSEDTHRGLAIPVAHYYDAVHNRRKSGLKESIPPNSIPVACCLRSGRQGVSRGVVRSATSFQTAFNPVWDNVSSCIGGNCLIDSSVRVERPIRATMAGLIGQEKLIVIEKQDCVNCETANIDLSKLVQTGYPIQITDINNDPGWIDVIYREKIREFPAFFFVRKTENGYSVIKSWGGCLNVKKRVVNAFSDVFYEKPCESAKMEEMAITPCDPVRLEETAANPCDPVELGPASMEVVPKSSLSDDLEKCAKTQDDLEEISQELKKIEEGNKERVKNLEKIHEDLAVIGGKIENFRILQESVKKEPVKEEPKTDDIKELPEIKECENDQCLTDNIIKDQQKIAANLKRVPFITKALYNVSGEEDKKDYLFAEPTYYSSQPSDPLTENYESGFFRQKPKESDNSGVIGNAIENKTNNIAKMIQSEIIKMAFMFALIQVAVLIGFEVLKVWFKKRKQEQNEKMKLEEELKEFRKTQTKTKNS